MRQSSNVVQPSQSEKFEKKNRKVAATILASAGLGLGLLLSPAGISAAHAQKVVEVPRQCSNGLCGRTEYWGGRVRIRVTGSSVSRHTHYNLRVGRGGQMEVRGPLRHTFEQRPGRRGTYSVQSCERGGAFARSTCGRWVTFDWRS